VGVSTLEALALGAVGPARERGSDVVLAVLDARRGEVFAAAWGLDAFDDGGGPAIAAPLLHPVALAPERLVSIAAELGANGLAVGDGAVEFRAVLEQSGTVIPHGTSELHRVAATNHCRLADGAASADTDAVRPEYLRLPDAELSLLAARQR
jgi:tRNA threonylcarbamoyladenosine biosynthesis protein TsaB